MSEYFHWLTRPWTGRRQNQAAYIYLYSPNMRESSTSSSHCLTCLLFGLCLAFIVILSAIIIYQLNSSESPAARSTTDSSFCCSSKKRDLPDFVNVNIDPCEHFYNFVCDEWARGKTRHSTSDHDYLWSQMRLEMHQQLMTNISDEISEDSNEKTKKFYQLCEYHSAALLLDEVERHFANLSQSEPYQSYLTLFNRTKPISSNVSIAEALKVFVKIENVSTSSLKLVRTLNRRPMPTAISIFPNLTILNQTALKELIQFDDLYRKILIQEEKLIQNYAKRSNIDSIIFERIKTYSDYNLCTNVSFNSTNGLKNLVEVLKDFLRSRLRHLKTTSIDKQIRNLEKISEPSTLIEHLRRIRNNLKTIDQLIISKDENRFHNASCIVGLLEKLLDERVRLNELPNFIQNLFEKDFQGFFISDDWPFFAMISEQLLKHRSSDSIVNFAFFHSYRQVIYPYYQPHIDRENVIQLYHREETKRLTGRGVQTDRSCVVNSCFDILNCYHPSLINRLVIDQNLTLFDEIRRSAESLILRFRSLIEQSDDLRSSQKQVLLDNLNKIKIKIGEISDKNDINLDSSNDWSYLNYAQYLSGLNYDQTEKSYDIEPVYFPSSRTIYLPFGLIRHSNETIDYQLVKLLLKIFRETLSSNPFHIECFLQSNENDWSTRTQRPSTDEQLTYIFLRSKYMEEKKILSDEYLWPFVKANELMKYFLIDYTAKHYCQMNLIDRHLINNTYLIDDVHLLFFCQKAALIKQSKCTII